MSSILHLTADVRNLDALHRVANESDKVFALPDNMAWGPLKDPEGLKKFDELRCHFIANMRSQIGESIETHNDEAAGNVKLIEEISSELRNNPDTELYYWMAGNAVDVMGYFFVLHFLRTHYERIKVINIAGLPFLTDDFKMIFPDRFANLNQKQMSKAMTLARAVTASEMEVEGEEWKQLRDLEGLRILSGSRKIQTLPYEAFDADIKSAHKQGAKPTRTAQQLIQKSMGDFPLEFIIWRIQTLFPNNNTPQDNTPLH